jgi:hypothetical protein|tara:strand:+ start:185 stop:514 length:330 start_codon:yes stop_codon:yes gene_type:complete
MNKPIYKNPKGEIVKVDGYKTVYEIRPYSRIQGQPWRAGTAQAHSTSRGYYHGYTTARKLIEYLASMWAKEQEWEPKKGQQLELFPHPMDNPDNNPFLAKITNRFNCPC